MTFPQFLGTAEVPKQYWKAANLIGQIPFLASSLDQRASYCMYIPEAHYQVSRQSKLPLIVNVHSSNRRAERCRDSLIDLADRIGAAVLAPLFPAAILDPNESQNYKFLRYADIRYDLILLSMVEEVAKRWPGVETDKFCLVGFSGGGQFVSRFFYLYPHRLRAVSIGAPGVVTSLDSSLEWPKGLKNVEQHLEGTLVDVGALRCVSNVQLIVGEKDVEPSGNELIQWFTSQKYEDDRLKAIGKHLPCRVEAIAKLHADLLSAGVDVRYDVVPEVAHEGQKLLPTVIEFLESVLEHK